MAPLTRKELVLQLLRQHSGEWVDGPRIASPEVGGSEGLKRLRELRQEGFDIRMRKHPDPRRDIFQYRLVQSVMISSAPRNEIYERSVHPPTPGMAAREFPLKKNEDGSIEVVYEVCDECGGRYAVKTDHLKGLEHRRWANGGFLDVEAGAPTYIYTESPGTVAFGEAVICPRCHGVRRKAKWLSKGLRPADEMCMDPKNHDVVCIRCNGWGVIPNQGPVASATLPVKPETTPDPEDPPTAAAFDE